MGSERESVPTTFRTEIEELDGGVRVVCVIGELDQATIPELQRGLDEVIHSGSDSMLVDLSDCEFIDSSGLAALVGARERLTDGGGRRFGICCPDSQVQRLLEITGLDAAMGLVATREEALETLRA
jgi:anti-sigma B factor antagonist